MVDRTGSDSPRGEHVLLAAQVLAVDLTVPALGQECASLRTQLQAALPDQLTMHLPDRALVVRRRNEMGQTVYAADLTGLAALVGFYYLGSFAVESAGTDPAPGPALEALRADLRTPCTTIRPSG